MSTPSENSGALPHGTSAEVDLDALRHNVQAAVKLAGGDCSRIMAVVKADAYGHGLAGIVRALSDPCPVGRFGVANLGEATEIRKINASTPVVILGSALAEERSAIVAHGFEPSLSTLEEAFAFQELAAQAEAELNVHVVVDTGMGRMGFLECRGIDPIIRIATECSNLRIIGVASHFPSADEDEIFTRQQAERFLHLLDELEGSGVKPELVHIDNSAGLMIHAGSDRCTLVRTGLMLYGIAPIPAAQGSLRPVLALKSKVTLVRKVPAGHSISYGRTYSTSHPTTVATVAIGYGDGYPRHLSGTGCEVLIHGRRCPLLGRITMDQIMVDVSDLEAPDPVLGPGLPAQAGDEVVLIGAQGRECILATELADHAGTIAWEIFTGITRRVPRVYREEAPADGREISLESPPDTS